MIKAVKCADIDKETKITNPEFNNRKLLSVNFYIPDAKNSATK